MSARGNRRRGVLMFVCNRVLGLAGLVAISLVVLLPSGGAVAAPDISTPPKPRPVPAAPRAPVTDPAIEATRAAKAAAEAAIAERARRCALPAEVESATVALPAMAKALRNPAVIPRLVVLSPQTSNNRAAVRDLAAYPARLADSLERELAPELRSRKVAIEVVIKPLGTAEDLSSLITKQVLPQKPTLVVWQIGRSDARRGTPPFRFADQLNRGLGVLIDKGIDVIVLDLQYHPQFEAMFRTDEYRNYVRWVTAKRDVALLRRYDMIEHWVTEGLIDLDSGSAEGERTSFEFIQDCLSYHLTRMIALGARQ